MPPQDKERRKLNKFYVYVLYRRDGVTPFYVGMGHGYRWMEHEYDCAEGKSPKDDIIAEFIKDGLVVPKKKIAENLDWESGCALESQLILSIGRLPNGPLVNKTDGTGGTGRFPDAETREKMRRAKLGTTRIFSEEHKRKLSEHAKRRNATPEYKALLRSRTGWNHTAEANEKNRIAHLGKKQSEETRRKRSESLKRVYAER
jgi:hypothetical protein